MLPRWRRYEPASTLLTSNCPAADTLARAPWHVPLCSCRPSLRKKSLAER
jgi:hypothetical protein